MHQLGRVILKWFSASYQEAHENFCAACHHHGHAPTTVVHPLQDPNGNRLFTDIVHIGAAEPEKLLVVVSGTHGLEGFAGSAAQVAWLHAGAHGLADPRTGVTLIHMLNPWGAAWRRRQTEDNVDLNRNFVDFSAPRPDNRAYELIHPALLCPEWEGPERDRARACIGKFRAQSGETRFANALFQGQYRHADGVGFGGNRPTWSREVLERIITARATRASTIAIVDIHTGLGAFGVGTPINTHLPGSGALHRAQSWYGHSLLSVRAGGVLPYELHGDIGSGLSRALPHACVVCVSLEFGTYLLERLLGLQIEDCWLWNHGDPNSRIGRKIRDDLQAFFYPRTRDWMEAVVVRSLQVIGQALDGLQRA